MGTAHSVGECCSPAACSEHWSFGAEEPPLPTLCPTPRDDPARLFRDLDAAVEEEQKPGEEVEGRDALVGDVPKPPRRPRSARLSRQAPPPPSKSPPLKSEKASLSDDLAEIFPQAKARAARRHLTEAKSWSAQSMQSAIKV